MKGTTLLICILSVIFVAQCSSVKRVHVIFMNHLDVGFTMENVDVINEYFDEYFPMAVRVADECRIVKAERYIYTTHPFLVSLYLNCPENGVFHCPTEKNRTEFIRSVQRGDITWHAFPLNAEVELLSSTLFSECLEVASDLANEFSVPIPTVLTQRDVPGLTRAAIPLLAKKGIRAVSVGVNTCSMPPAVPSVFRWVDEQSSTEVFGMWHPGGYGGLKKRDCVVVDGFEHALCFAFNGDNNGPQTTLDVVGILELFRIEFPGAEVRSSTFDAFVVELEGVKDLLEVHKEEIGDTWIHGVSSDPLKLSAQREIARQVDECVETGACNVDSPEFKNFTRFFVKLCEHTWGVDVKKYLGDWKNWSNDLFEAARGGSNFQKMEKSWYGQRAWIDYSLSALGEGYPSLVASIRSAIDARVPASPPSISGWSPVTSQLTFGDATVEFDAVTGSIVHLAVNEKVFADSSHVLGSLLYQTFNQSDIDEMFRTYMYVDTDTHSWVVLDFGKLGMQEVNPESRVWNPESSKIYYDNKNTVQVWTTFPATTVEMYGAPELAVVEYVFGSNGIDIDVSFFNKTATRLTEALWFSFNPIVAKPQDWLMDKLDSKISPLDVNVNGSRHLHSIWSGMFSEDLSIKTLDAPLMSPGQFHLYPGDRSQPDLSNGFSFNLINNIWGTNYIMWYPFGDELGSFSYRFSMEM